MRVTKQSLDSFAHAAEFFLKNPNALAGAEKIIQEKGLKNTICDGAQMLRREISEHEKSKSTVREVKKNLRTCEHKLHDLADFLEDHFAQILEAEKIFDQFNYSYDKKNSVSSYEKLISEIEKFPQLVQKNGTFQKKFLEFKNEFAQYKKEFSTVGVAISAKIREEAEKKSAVQKFFTVVSALIYFVYHYLRLSNSTLFAEWRNSRK